MVRSSNVSENEVDESEESEESGERYRQGIYGSMKRFRTKFWRYFKIFLQAIRKKKTLHHRFRDEVYREKKRFDP